MPERREDKKSLFLLPESLLAECTLVSEEDAKAPALALPTGHVTKTDTPTDLQPPRFEGRIKSFNEAKGFGFIDCPTMLRAFGRDVFIHRNQLREAGLMVGDVVTFEVERNKEGQPQARSAQAVSPAVYNEQASDFCSNGQVQGLPAYGQVSNIDTLARLGQPPGKFTKAKGTIADSKGKGKGKGKPKGHIMAKGQGRPQELQLPERGFPEVDMALQHCSSSQEMMELIERYGHQFGRTHVVTALFKIGISRQYSCSCMDVRLSSALVDRLVLVPPRELSADEATKAAWALSIFGEIREKKAAQQFAMELGNEALRRVFEFSPHQMATFAGSLSKLAFSSIEKDELVAQITTTFSDYALGDGCIPRFPPEEMRSWTGFLQEATGGNQRVDIRSSVPGPATDDPAAQAAIACEAWRATKAWSVASEKAREAARERQAYERRQAAG